MSRSVPGDGGEERAELDEVLHEAHWSVWEDNIVFISQDENVGPAIELFNLRSRETTRLTALGRDTRLAFGDIAVSPDGRWILYPRLDRSGSDLILVEDVR